MNCPYWKGKYPSQTRKSEAPGYQKCDGKICFRLEEGADYYGATLVEYRCSKCWTVVRAPDGFPVNLSCLEQEIQDKLDQLARKDHDDEN